MITLLHEQSETVCSSARAEGDELWLNASDLAAATGWSLKPEGLCRGDLCLPVPPGRSSDYLDGESLNAAAFWRRMQHPVVHNAAGDLWVLGTNASERSSALQSLEAPDFALPDLTGAHFSLAQQRGKKVLLATWASW